MRRRMSWDELGTGGRVALVAAATVQLGLLAAALTDVLRRPRVQLTGPRWAWVAACFVNVVGPIAYFAAGRRGRGLRR